MKAFLIFIILLTVSCSSTKKVDHSTKVDERINQSVDEQKLVQAETEQSSKLDIKTSEAEKDTEDYFVKLITFDTSQPVNEVTGRAPVSTELIIMRSKNLDKRIESTLTVENESDSRTVEHSDYKSDFSQKRDSTSYMKEVTFAENKCRGSRTLLGFFIVVLLVVCRRFIVRFFLNVFRK